MQERLSWWRGTGLIDRMFDTVSGGVRSRAEQGKRQMNSVDVNAGSGPIPLTCCETDPYTEVARGDFRPRWARLTRSPLSHRERNGRT